MPHVRFVLQVPLRFGANPVLRRSLLLSHLPVDVFRTAWLGGEPPEQRQVDMSGTVKSMCQVLASRHLRGLRTSLAHDCSWIFPLLCIKLSAYIRTVETP